MGGLVVETPDDGGLLQRWRLFAPAFSQGGQSAEAAAAMRRVLALQPSDPPCRFQLALEAERGGETARAIGFYDRGLAVAPRSVEALERLAALRFAGGAGALALSILLRARTHSGPNPPIEGEVARIASALGRSEAARSAGRRHLALEPTALLAHPGLAQLPFTAAEPLPALPSF